MTEKKFVELLKSGPFQVTMNNGDIFIIENSEMAVADLQTAAILHRDADGRRRMHIIALRNISSAQPIDLELR